MRFQFLCTNFAFKMPTHIHLWHRFLSRETDKLALFNLMLSIVVKWWINSWITLQRYYSYCCFKYLYIIFLAQLAVICVALHVLFQVVYMDFYQHAAIHLIGRRSDVTLSISQLSQNALTLGHGQQIFIELIRLSGSLS